MQVRKIAFISALLLGASVSFSESARASDCSELPADVKIKCFDTADLSKSQAAFCGIWGESKWGNVLPHCLAVERISPKGAARIVYAWGKAPRWDIGKSGYVRAKAIIKKTKLKSKLPNGAYVEYRLSGDKLRGNYRWRNFRTKIVLKRFEK